MYLLQLFLWWLTEKIGIYAAVQLNNSSLRKCHVFPKIMNQAFNRQPIKVHTKAVVVVMDKILNQENEKVLVTALTRNLTFQKKIFIPAYYTYTHGQTI